MKIGLIGPPQSGKSTLFSAITHQPVDPTKALQEHTAIIKVPDDRLDYLTGLYKPKKTTQATIECIDFPGISSHDDAGKQRYRKFLPQIRLCDALVAVVRNFSNDAVPPHRERIDPGADLAGLNDDFLFADLETVTARIERIGQGLRKPGREKEEQKKELAVLEQCQAALENLEPVWTVLNKSEDMAALVRSFAFLTEKPLIVVVNVSEQDAASAPTVEEPHAHSIMNVCAEAEAEISQLEDDDRAAFLADLGIERPARERFVQSCYEAAGLISFLTTGEDEVRAWTVRHASSAVEAAGKIHSDIARGFIRAETMAYDDLRAADGDEKAVKSAGKLRQEGKDYVVQDGDIIHFKFNV